MLSRIFLGKPVHWLAILLAAAGLWALGDARLHVRDFNLFTAGLAAIAVALLAVVILTTRRQEQVTRDPIPDAED